jgi:hypothetical protein
MIVLLIIMALGEVVGQCQQCLVPSCSLTITIGLDTDCTTVNQIEQLTTIASKSIHIASYSNCLMITIPFSATFATITISVPLSFDSLSVKRSLLCHLVAYVNNRTWLM